MDADLCVLVRVRALGSFTVKNSLVGQIFLPPVLQKSNNAKPRERVAHLYPLEGRLSPLDTQRVSAPHSLLTQQFIPVGRGSEVFVLYRG